MEIVVVFFAVGYLMGECIGFIIGMNMFFLYGVFFWNRSVYKNDNRKIIFNIFDKKTG
jgi:hypothetical protein